MEQISLFDLDNTVNERTAELVKTPEPTPVASTPAKKRVEPEKPMLSQDIINKLNQIENLDDICHFMQTNTCYLNINRGYTAAAGGYIVDLRGARKPNYESQLASKELSTCLHFDRCWSDVSEKQTMVYFDEYGNAWSRSCRAHLIGDAHLGYHDRYSRLLERYNVIITWESAKWRLITGLPADSIIFLQNEHERQHIFETTKPYTYKFYKDNSSRFSMELLMLCPQIELLDKAGYKFVEQLKQYPEHIDTATVTSFNRLIKFETKPGKLQNLFKTTTEVCKILKEERQLLIWDQIRKVEKYSKTSPDELQIVYDNHYSDGELANIQNILKQQYHNKNVFTFSSLVNYLNRLDQYEAIETTTALMLIRDYLESCRMLDMEPRIDGDSLKREHDVAARLVREKRNEIEAARLVEGCKKLQQYNYENDRFIIRGIRDYNDLLDEAKQQHNCVASYSHRIASGTSLIFVMRRKTVPNRSFVTIELSPDLSTVRQKFEAHNQPLRNREASEFIDEWQQHCKDVKKGKIKPCILECENERNALLPEDSEPDPVEAAIDEAFDTDDEIDI